MVGHTGNYEATVKSMEAVDENLGRIMKACEETNTILLVTADHGNAEVMINEKGEVVTSHTTNPVPFMIY
jgi:2,3-bisphosphoglycerate-independent phosphoglycerate mutase